MRKGVHRCLVWEVPSPRTSGDGRHACHFEQIKAETEQRYPYLCEAPARLYNEIAMNLCESEWRTAGLIRLAMELTKCRSTTEKLAIHKSTHKERSQKSGRSTGDRSRRSAGNSIEESAERVHLLTRAAQSWTAGKTATRRRIASFVAKQRDSAVMQKITPSTRKLRGSLASADSAA